MSPLIAQAILCVNLLLISPGLAFLWLNPTGREGRLPCFPGESEEFSLQHLDS